MSNLRYDPYVKKYITKDEYVQFNLGGLPNVSMLEEQWEKLEPLIGYDSEADTRKHIARVNELLNNAAIELLKRANQHDLSKLSGTEKAYFDAFTPKLKRTTYGTHEYKAMLEQLQFALGLHYEANSHHPEHYENGIDGMDLFDVVEMFFDWKAASERHEDGCIMKSIDINEKRFKMSSQLAQIFRNTVKYTQ